MSWLLIILAFGAVEIKGKIFNEPGGGCYYQEQIGDTSDEAASMSEELACTLASLDLTQKQLLYVRRLGKLARSGKYPMVTRKEVRRLNTAERLTLFKTFNKMRRTKIDGLSQYDIFVKIHARGVAPSATRVGPATWGWHREYLLRFEMALRLHDPFVSIAYWDPRLERHLFNNCESIIWSKDFFGNAKGIVTEGPFKYWQLTSNCLEAMNTVVLNTTYVDRDCAVISDNDTYYGGYGFSDYDVQKIMQQKNFNDFVNLACAGDDHDVWHRVVGGIQNGLIDAPACGVSDPIFWMGHSFVNLLFEQWMAVNNYPNLLDEYPATNYSCHLREHVLYPFQPMTNADSFGNDYEKIYNYETTPYFCSRDSHCRSSFLWCDFTSRRCVSKITQGGSCLTVPQRACVSGKCSDGMCT